jgi:uncharacterized protein YjbJ (UPF0337 family)
MNKEEFETKWKEMRAPVKEWWGRLRDDELDRTRGNAGQVIGLLQKKYGYTRDRAEREFDRRLAAFEIQPLDVPNS